MPREIQWTVEDAALALDVHRETIRRWIRNGRLPATLPLGRKTGYRIATEDLDPLVQERQRHLAAVTGQQGQCEFVESSRVVSIDGSELPNPPLPPIPFATNRELLEYVDTCLKLAGLAQDELKRRLGAGE
jgi:excisionase family DNA binding protein